MLGPEAGVLHVDAGVGVQRRDEGAAVEGGDEAEGLVEGGDQVGDEVLQRADEFELRLPAGGDGLLQCPALLAHGREIVAAAGCGVGLRFHGRLRRRDRRGFWIVVAGLRQAGGREGRRGR